MVRGLDGSVAEVRVAAASDLGGGGGGGQEMALAQYMVVGVDCSHHKQLSVAWN